jgi:hypothetical protein
MVHHRQGLPFGLEPGNHLPGVHPQFDDLQGHLPPDGSFAIAQDACARRPEQCGPRARRLLGHIHHRHPPLANPLQQLVPPNDRPGALFHHGLVRADIGIEHGHVQKAGRIVVLQKGLHAGQQSSVVAAGLQNISLPLTTVLTLDGDLEDRLFRILFVLYHRTPCEAGLLSTRNRAHDGTEIS